MNPVGKVTGKLAKLYRQHVMRDPFLREVARWVRDKGDESLRLNYPLSRDSIVFDLGGYRGDFAAAIHQRYGCRVFVFEPVPQFHRMCVERFRGNDSIVCLNYGLSDHKGSLDIVLNDDASSLVACGGAGERVRVQLHSVVDCIHELEISCIDLMKINIEGGEFDVIPALIESGLITQVCHLQVQFHNFIERAGQRRAAIREHLVLTHAEMWNYEFVWESWTLRTTDSSQQ